MPLQAWGGIESQIAEQARGLADLGHEVHILTVGPSDRIETFTQAGIHYHRLARAGASRAGAKSLLAGVIRFSIRVHRLLRRLNPELVHYHSRYPCYLGLLLSPKRSVRWRSVFHAHNLRKPKFSIRFSHRWAAALLGAWIDRRIARRMDHVIAISHFMKAYIIQSSGINPDRVSVLTNIIDHHTFQPEPAQPRRPELVFVGRIAAEKGLTTLIEAMGQVAEVHPEVTLRIIGPDKGGTEFGAYLRICEELVARLGLQTFVRFEGEVPNHRLPQILRQARLLVVPSVESEPCGLVVIEGLACGIPVVGSRVGGIPELIEEGKTGLLAPPADPESLARVILEALDSDQLLSSAAAQGPQYVAERHTWESVKDRLMGIYQQLLNSGDMTGPETAKTNDSARRLGNGGGRFHV